MKYKKLKSEEHYIKFLYNDFEVHNNKLLKVEYILEYNENTGKYNKEKKYINKNKIGCEAINDNIYISFIDSKLKSKITKHLYFLKNKEEYEILIKNNITSEEYKKLLNIIKNKNESSHKYKFFRWFVK
jgi:hypothetical protein